VGSTARAEKSFGGNKILHNQGRRLRENLFQYLKREDVREAAGKLFGKKGAKTLSAKDEREQNVLYLKPWEKSPRTKVKIRHCQTPSLKLGNLHIVFGLQVGIV